MLITRSVITTSWTGILEICPSVTLWYHYHSLTCQYDIWSLLLHRPFPQTWGHHWNERPGPRKVERVLNNIIDGFCVWGQATDQIRWCSKRMCIKQWCPQVRGWPNRTKMAVNEVANVLKDAQCRAKTFVDLCFSNEWYSTTPIKSIGQCKMWQHKHKR